MNKETYFLQLSGEYAYKEGDKNIKFIIEGKEFITLKSNVVYILEQDKKGQFKFLMKFSSKEYKRLTTVTGKTFDPRPGFGTEYVKPRNPPPPDDINVVEAVRIRY